MAQNPAVNSTSSFSPAENNVVWHTGKVNHIDRARLLGQQPATVWFTGLSGAGKSTIAFELERQLIAKGRLAFVLDGDNVRHGLNRDIGFSPEDRHENIRRIAEVAKLINDAGLLVIASFISPYRLDRVMAREIIGSERFVETYISTSLDVCERRDPKGLYKKARKGLIPEFTGISAPFEAPEAPDLSIDTAYLAPSQAATKIIEKLSPYLRLA